MAKTAKETNAEKIFADRMSKKVDELRWLYMELYGNDSMFAELCDQMWAFYKERTDALKNLDIKREADPQWYKKNDMLGMMFYIDTEVPGGIRLETPVEEHARTVGVESPLPEDMRALLDAEI